MFHVKPAADAGGGAGPPPPRPSGPLRHTLRYSGQVQGVGFRWTVRGLVGDLPLDGYVRNLRDGTVELVLEGAPRDLEVAETRIRSRFDACIRDVEAATSPATGEFAGFAIVR